MRLPISSFAPSNSVSRGIRRSGLGGVGKELQWSFGRQEGWTECLGGGTFDCQVPSPEEASTRFGY
jgi:hypothetical protein